MLMRFPPDVLLDVSSIVRLSSQRLIFFDASRAPRQKLDLQGLVADLPLGLLRIIPGPFSEAWKGVAWPPTELAPPAVQNGGIHFKGPCDFDNRRARFQSLDHCQFRFAREDSSRQSHDTNSRFNDNCVLTGCLQNRDNSTLIRQNL
jgi:hypothetical protein